MVECAPGLTASRINGSYLSAELIEEKYEILEGFCIDVTKDIRMGLYSCRSEIELDRYCHAIIFSSLGDD